MEGEVKVNLSVTLGKLSVSQFCGQSIDLTVSVSVCLSATQPVVCWLFSLSYSYFKQCICRSFTHGLARHTVSVQHESAGYNSHFFESSNDSEFLFYLVLVSRRK